MSKRCSLLSSNALRGRLLFLKVAFCKSSHLQMSMYCSSRSTDGGNDISENKEVIEPTEIHLIRKYQAFNVSELVAKHAVSKLEGKK